MANRVRAKVTRLFVHKKGISIRLDLPKSQQPKGANYFHLEPNHPNYDALYSLALTAAVNRLVLDIRILGGEDITDVERPRIHYMVIDW